MGAIHDPAEAALAPCRLQGGSDRPRAGQGPHLDLQGRMGPIGPAGRLSHHAHAQAPPPRQQLAGQLGPFADATDQPDRLCRRAGLLLRFGDLARGAVIPLVDFRAVHQDGTPWRSPDP